MSASRAVLGHVCNTRLLTINPLRLQRALAGGGAPPACTSPSSSAPVAFAGTPRCSPKSPASITDHTSLPPVPSAFPSSFTQWSPATPVDAPLRERAHGAHPHAGTAGAAGRHLRWLLDCVSTGAVVGSINVPAVGAFLPVLVLTCSINYSLSACHRTGRGQRRVGGQGCRPSGGRMLGAGVQTVQHTFTRLHLVLRHHFHLHHLLLFYRAPLTDSQ